jgi:hypothetical protein
MLSSIVLLNQEMVAGCQKRLGHGEAVSGIYIHSLDSLFTGFLCIGRNMVRSCRATAVGSLASQPGASHDVWLWQRSSILLLTRLSCRLGHAYGRLWQALWFDATNPAIAQSAASFRRSCCSQNGDLRLSSSSISHLH